MVGCRVALLDGTTFEPKGIDKNADGQALFEKVTKHLDIIETDYFGLTYRDKTGKKYWLDVSKKISKQVNGGTWVFEFQVKFYTPDPMSLKEDITRYQLCLQLRVDIFNGKLPCSFATYALLGSYTVQSELGDWDPIEFGTGIEYLHDFDFAPTQNAELLEKIAELHKHHKGLTPTMSEAHFLENAKKLAMFGVDLHEAKDSENKDIQLGVCANGILVYKDRLRINRFVWPKILKLSYKRNNFYVKVRPGEFEPHERTIMFRLENHKLAKRLWKTCVEHHAFFRLKETDPHNTDTLFPRFNTRYRYSGRTAHQARKAAEQVQRDEPHIARTAERRSLGHNDHKPRHLEDGTMQKKPTSDESDMYDKKRDPNATAEMGANANAALMDGKYKSAPSDVKANYMQLLAEKNIDSKTPWNEAQRDIKDDHRYHAVPTDAQRKEWYDEYQQNLVKAAYMQLLAETPTIHSQTRWSEAEQDIKHDPRYAAVPRKELREPWFDEYINNLVKTEYMQLLHETDSITCTTPWEQAQQDIYRDRRYQAVPTDQQRKDWYDEFLQALKRNEFMRLLQDTPAITSNTKWSEAKKAIASDPRYQAVGTDAEREQLFNEYVQGLGPPPYSPGDGKKDKKAKEEEKRRKKEEEQRKKEEERRRKEEEKERKRLEKEEKKKHKGKPAETNLDGDDHLEQSKEKEKNRRSGGFFGFFRRKSKKETPEKQEGEVTPVVAEVEIEVKAEATTEAKAEAKAESKAESSSSSEEEEEEVIEQKPKPIMTWALPGMKEMMDKKKAENHQESEEEEEERERPTRVPSIKIDEAPPVSDDEDEEPVTQEYNPQYQSEVQTVPEIEVQAVTQSEIAEQTETQSEPEIQVQSETLVETSAELKGDNPEAFDDSEAAVQAEAAEIVRDVIERAVEVVGAESCPVAMTMECTMMSDIQLKEDFTQLLRETPDVTSQSRLADVKHELQLDPRYQAVGNDARREKWFNEYTDKMLKDDFMRLLMDTPTITSQSSWSDASQEIDRDPRYAAVNSEAKRKEWFDEYVQNLLKQDYMQLLKDTPTIHSLSRWEGVKPYIETYPAYIAVGNDAKREAWFDEYMQDLKKEEFMQLLSDTPSITSYSHYPEAREEICNDPRFSNVDTEAQREEYFNDYTQNLKKQGFMQLLQDTPDITANSQWHEAKHKIDTDPRYHAVDGDLYRSVWFNQYVNRLAGFGYGDGDFGMRIGDYKSIDRKQEFEPIIPPNVTTRKSPETMPFFEPVGESDDSKKRVPPPIARKPRVASGYDSEEDRILRNSSGVPVTVETETFKYLHDNDDMPKATSKIPIVETRTQKVTYEKDGVPYETEDSILVSAHSVTTKSQTIDTTTYKTERDGMVETRVERKITVISDDDDGCDHDALLRAAIEHVTSMNQSFEVERIECVRQIEDK